MKLAALPVICNPSTERYEHPNGAIGLIFDSTLNGRVGTSRNFGVSVFREEDY